MKNFYIYQTMDSTKAVYNEISKVSFFRLFPGVILGHNDIKTNELPADLFAPIFQSDAIMRINFSLSGVCEVRTGAGNCIYVKGGSMSISRDTSPKTFLYPSSNYEGVELYLFQDAFLSNHPFFDLFGITVQGLKDTYLKHQVTLVTDRWTAYLPIVKALQNLIKESAPDMEQMRLYVLLLFRMLCVEEIRLEPVLIPALTIRQVNLARKAEKLLTENLARRKSITEIANQLGVGASSLKNWFRSIFGKNISVYMRDLRIQEAKRLLSDSSLSIADISAKVGFENQAKFTAMFHKYCGYTPTAYRKQCIEHLQ